jgi:Tfp pilus assembly PilM family ATPase
MALILGIDIGNHSVRGALVRTSMRAFEVERYVEVPVAALSAGGAQRSLLADAVRQLVQELPSPPDSVMACLDGMRGSLRVITIPVAAKKRAAEVLPFELESLLPFPIEEALIDFQEQGLREGQLALMTAATPETAVGDAMQLWDEAGVTPRELCVGALALEGALSFLVQPPDEVWLMVHVDGEQSDACFVQNGKVELCRTFDEGSASLRAGSRAVHMALHQTVMKYRAEGGPQLRRLIVMGEAALDGRLVASMGEALNVAAEAFAPPASKQGQGMVSPVFGKALALAGRALRRGKRIDLRKGKYALPRGVNQLRGYALLAALCTLALVSSYTFSVWAQYRVLSAERDTLSAKLE